MERTNVIERAKEHFAGILKNTARALERIRSEQDWVDYATLKPIVVGILGATGSARTSRTKQ